MKITWPDSGSRVPFIKGVQGPSSAALKNIENSFIPLPFTKFLKEIVLIFVEHLRPSIIKALDPVSPAGALQAASQSLIRTLGPDSPELLATTIWCSHPPGQNFVRLIPITMVRMIIISLSRL